MNIQEHIEKVGVTDYKCEICGRNVTTPSYFYSMKKFGKPHCYTCGRLIESEKTISSHTGEKSPDESAQRTFPSGDKA